MTSVSFCRSNRAVRSDAREKTAGFTLVEIMVVIGIIAILAAMLMPALAKVRESSRRTKCAANLKDMGMAAHGFADLHGGRYPMCYRMRDDIPNQVQYPFYVPFVIPQADKLSNDSDPAMWTVFGTSWSAWQQFGVTLGTLSCPSAQRVAIDQDLTGTHVEWGAVVWSTYMYVGGLTSTIIAGAPYSTPYTAASKVNWGTAPPAVTTFDNNLSETVLAGDLVFYSGENASWDPKWMINHPTKDVAMRTPASSSAVATFSPVPDFQNILYGDGHVAPKQRGDFPYALNTIPTAEYGPISPEKQWNFSFVSDPGGGIGGYMYWGEMNSIQPSKPPALPGPPEYTGSGDGKPLHVDLPNTFTPPTPPSLYNPPTAIGTPRPVPIPG